MFKKKYLAVAGLMALAVVISGCGKKNSGDSVVQATPTPTQETAVTATPTPELINMEETVEKNVMGEKTSTASKVTIVNKTGSEIAAIYVRETPSDDDSEDDEWGDDLVNGMFTLKNGENAVYYYEKGTSSATYDIRITYSDEEKNECFFRKLPLTTIKQITLRMDGSGDDSIPYATYMTASSTKEISTLNDVKKRLGMSTDDSDSDSSATPTPSDSSDSNSSDSSGSDSNNTNPTGTPSADNTKTPDDDNTDPTSSTIQTAEGYIGMSIDDLESAVGASQSSEYDDDDTAGTTGYYYYSDFTVSTSVDENGNEIVTGVW